MIKKVKDIEKEGKIPLEAPKGFSMDTPASQQVRPFRERLDWVVRRVMDAAEETSTDLNRNATNIGLSSREFS